MSNPITRALKRLLKVVVRVGKDELEKEVEKRTGDDPRPPKPPWQNWPR